MACPVCGEDQFSTLREIDSTLRSIPDGLDRALHVRVSVDRCAVCGLLRSVDHGGLEAVESVSFDASATKVRAAGARSVSSTDELRMLSLRPPASLLDVGCGAGQFLLRATSAGFDAQGIDPDPQSVAFVLDDLDLTARLGSLEVLGDDERFDVISMLGVLEHIADPVAFLTNASAHLSARGEVLVGVPNTASINRRVSRLSQHDWDMLLEPGHLYHYSPRTLRLLGERAGLRMQRWRTGTITIRGKVPFLPVRIPVVERLVRAATAVRPVRRAYVAGLRGLDRIKMGDTVLAVFTLPQ
jgi:2-polyprenyl-3-methyl-5-hydroxy-6-metoxy-1,4-benzoquinol methylase